VLCALECEGLAEADEAGLCRGVGKLSVPALPAGHRGHPDYSAPAALFHPGVDLPGDVVRAGEVGGHVAVPDRVVELLDAVAGVDQPRVVHQDIDAAGLCVDRLDSLRNGRAVREVTADCVCGSTVGPYLVGNSLGGLAVGVERDDRRALGCQYATRLGPDSSAAARYQRRPVVESELHRTRVLAGAISRLWSPPTKHNPFAAARPTCGDGGV